MRRKPTIELADGIYVAKVPFRLKEAVKAAGFKWGYLNREWYTRDPNAAARLQAVLDGEVAVGRPPDERPKWLIYQEANQAAATIILEEIERYGGSESGLVRWAGLIRKKYGLIGLGPAAAAPAVPRS